MTLEMRTRDDYCSAHTRDEDNADLYGQATAVYVGWHYYGTTLCMHGQGVCLQHLGNVLKMQKGILVYSMLVWCFVSVLRPCACSTSATC